MLEQVFSDPTAPVANVNDPPVGTVALSDITPTATQPITATPVITDADGLTTAVFDFQWQQSATGADGTWTDIAGAIGPVFAPTNDQAGLHLRAEVTYVDDHGTTEHVFSEATQLVGGALVGTGGSDTITGTAGFDLISGLGGSDTLSGLAGNDTIDGGAGNDTINGGAGDDVLIGGPGNDNITGDVGNDTITGGTGTDIINAGAGDDLINYTMGDGVDTIIGDVGADTLKIVGTAGADTLDVIYNGSVLTGIEGGTLSGVETVTADLLGGSDTLSYGTGTTAGVNVNLTTHTASGFASITGIENVTGGSGADALTGDALANALTGGAGNDTLVGGLGNDTLVGGTGVDTVSYAGETDAMFVNLATGSAERGSAANPVEDVLVTIENVVGGTRRATASPAIPPPTCSMAAPVPATIRCSVAPATIRCSAVTATTSWWAASATTRSMAAPAMMPSPTISAMAPTCWSMAVAATTSLSILGTAANNTLSVTWNGYGDHRADGNPADRRYRDVQGRPPGWHGYAELCRRDQWLSVDLCRPSVRRASPRSPGSRTSPVASGDDTLTGDSAANVLAGGAGNDTYVVGAGDTVTEGAGGGTDTVNSSVSFTLGNQR